MRLSKPSVYLAGPIKGLNYSGATQWRDYARSVLHEAGIEAYSPMRAKEYLRGLASVGQDALKDSYAQFPLSTTKAILCRDYTDCTRCDLIIANFLGAERVSIGTAMEVAWGYAARVPVVIVIEKDGSNLHENGFLLEAANFRVNTLDDALDVARAVLLPGPVPVGN